MTDHLRPDDKSTNKIKQIGLVLVAIAVIIGLYFLVQQSLKKEDEEVRSGQFSTTWTDLGRIGDTLFFVDNLTLTARKLDGGISFTRELPRDGFQLVYATDRLYLLLPHDQLEAIDPANGNILASIEATDIDRIEGDGAHLIAYTSSSIRTYNPSLERTAFLPLEGRPIAYDTSPVGKLAYIEEGFNRPVTSQGDFHYDIDAAFLKTPEVVRNEYGFPVYVKDEISDESADGEEAGSNKTHNRYRLSLGSEKEIGYRFATADQTLQQVEWISDDSALLITDSYFYIVYQGNLMAQQLLQEPTSYAIFANEVVLLTGSTLHYYSLEGSKLSDHQLDFSPSKVANANGQLLLIGDDFYATVEDGQIITEQTAPILFVLENADGSVDLLFENGIQRFE